MINPFTSPMLWLGALTFKNTRLDMYESLIDAMDDRASASPVNLQSVFEKWAQRDMKRMETRHMVFGNIANKLGRGGVSFAQALRPFVPAEEYLILVSGEVKGDLPGAMKLVVRNIRAGEAMNTSVSAAMAQPLIGLFSVLGMSIGYGVFLWPDFLRSMPRKYWPEWALPCIDVQIWVGQNWWMLSGLAVVVALYYATINVWIGPSRDLIDKLPPWSINKGRQASNLLGILSALVSSGRTVRESLVLVSDNSSPYMRWQIKRVIRRYDSSGEDAISAMRTGLFTQPVLDRIEDAAANRSFDKTLAHVGDTSLQLIVKIVHKQAEIANALFLIVIGILFFYITAVSVFGVQDATDALVKAMGGNGVSTR